MVDWNELQRELSEGKRKIEFITDDSKEYKVISERALISEDASAQYWFGAWQEKVTRNLHMAAYYYNEARKAGVEKAAEALKQIDETDKTSQGKKKNNHKIETNVPAVENVSPIWNIKEHDFKNAKLSIKNFSQKTEKDFEIRRVSDNKGVGEFFGDVFLGRGFGLSHSVSGEEFNSRMSAVQKHLQGINNTQIKLTREFGQVYSALEALDKDYIQAILVSIKATEKTSQGVKNAQENIGKLVNDQIKTLEILKKFKQKLEGYSHLGDVDKIWGDCQKWHQDILEYSGDISLAKKQSEENIEAIAELESVVKATEDRINHLSEQITIVVDGVDVARVYISTLEKIIHLQDIDEMWEGMSGAQDSIKSIRDDIKKLRTEVSAHREELDGMLDFRQELSKLEHLVDVDDIWASVNDYPTQLEELKEQNDNLIDSIRTKQVGMDERFAALSQNMTEATQATNMAIEELKKKVEYAYWIAGGSACLVVIELILLLMRVV